MIDEKLLYSTIGKRLKLIRSTSAGRNLTQDRLAQEVGLERTSITNIEAGNQRIPVHVLFELCKALGVGLSEVLPSIEDVSNELDVQVVNVGSDSYTVSAQIAGLVRGAK